MDVPDVRYARSGGVAVAYQVVGDGPRTIVFSPHLSDLYSLWLAPYSRPFLDRLASKVRLVVFDARGTGLSDRPRIVTLEARLEDITAILGATGIARASLVGSSTSANACALYAATYPSGCERLVLLSPYPRGIRSTEYPHGETEDTFLAYIREIRERWGDREFLEKSASQVDPAVTETPLALDWFVWQRRLSVGPSAAADWARLGMETDITDVLSSIRVPTLVLHRNEHRAIAQFVRVRIRDARSVEVRSVYNQAATDAILDFVQEESWPLVPDSVLATVLFTDLVASTERAAELGDRAWGQLLARHHADVRAELARFRGEEVDTAGDGFFCRFDGPARAIACARRIIESARDLELEVRAGIHTGECELVGQKIAGIAVVTGARISSLAGVGEVLVSSTVKDLVAGSGFSFEERGEHALKGVPGSWRLYAVADA